MFRSQTVTTRRTEQNSEECIQLSIPSSQDFFNNNKKRWYVATFIEEHVYSSLAACTTTIDRSVDSSNGQVQGLRTYYCMCMLLGVFKHPQINKILSLDSELTMQSISTRVLLLNSKLAY